MMNGRRTVKKITGGKPLTGKMTVPGDKSISHRALLLGSLAEGTSRVENIAPGGDLNSTIRCLRELGVKIREEGGQLEVVGTGLFGYEKPESHLDAGNSGTLMRILTGILTGQDFTSTITGDESLRSRPMERIIGPLTQMGGNITSREGRAPLEVTGSELNGITYRPQVASAQVKSSVLLAGIHARGKTTLIEPGPSRDHTERALKSMAYPIVQEENTISVRGPNKLKPLDITVPGDFSSASYFMAGAAIVDGSEIIIENVGLNQTRTGFLDLLSKMGADITVKNERTEAGEPRGDVVVTSSSLTGVKLSKEEVVRAIDELPLLAVVANQAKGRTEIRGAKELRVKETDRISAIVENLGSLGANVTEFEDGLAIEGPTTLVGDEVDSFNDHRIAMSAAIAAQAASGVTALRGPEWVEISFPGFFERLEGLKRG